MATKPAGDDPRPASAMGSQFQGGGSPGDIRAEYNQQVMRKLPASDQKRASQTSAKHDAMGTADTNALKEISQLMGPGLPNPFDELKNMQADQYKEAARREPTGFEPGERIPMPQARPPMLSDTTTHEPPTVDTARDLDKLIPTLLRMIAHKYAQGNWKPEPWGGMGNQAWMPSHTGAQEAFSEPGHLAEIPQDMTEIGETKLPTIPNRPYKEKEQTPTSRSAARKFTGQKRGGVAKKALALAKRRKKGGTKKR